MNWKLAVISAVLTATSTVAVGAVHTLRYDRPAPDSNEGWERQSLPIGCGHFGVNVFGIVENERLQVTHNAVINRRDNHSTETGNLTDALEIRVKFPHQEVTDYRRGLNLEHGLASVEYTAGGVRYARTYFTSYPSRTLVARFTASQAAALEFEISATAPFLKPWGKASANNGREAKSVISNDTIFVDQRFEAMDIDFSSALQVLLPNGGKLEKTATSLKVSGASEAVVVFTCDTNYEISPDRFALIDRGRIVEPRKPMVKKDVAGFVRRRLEAAARKGFDALLVEHLNDFGGLMRRAEINLGGDAADAEKTTDKLLSEYRRGKRSRYLEETYLQYGRYLLVSSSRPGTLPANLQGVWTCYDVSPWGSGYWHNINVQMNYWPAFSGNLAECFEAYAAFNAAFRPRTKSLAKKFVMEYTPELLPKRGEPEPDWWCIGTASYPYLICGGPGGHSGPGTGGLTTKCFTDWWEFTRDEKALKDYIFPTLHGMANFLVRCVRNYDGKYLSVFSASPEQIVEGVDWSWANGQVPYYHTIGCAFDQQMIWENNRDLVNLADVLGTNDAVIAKCREQLPHYDPVQIGASGQIKEFREENFYGEIGEKPHRHISQLVGLYPGTLITRETPEWLEAAKKTLVYRTDESTGWALAHRLNAWARIGDGDHCYLLLGNLLGKRTYDNLWDAHPPFQIDGNFGGTAGMIEMLLQSQAGYIDLLPALPKAWAKKGAFKGLCARGAFEVDCEWADGKPVKVAVRSLKGLKPDVRFAGKPCAFTLCQ